MLPGDDLEQVDGNEGWAEGAVKSADAELPFYTGRYHPLMQQDCSRIPEGALGADAVESVVPPQARDTSSIPMATVDSLAASFVSGTGPLALRGGGDQVQEEPDRQRGAGVWNLAGAEKRKVKGIITTVFEGDIVAIQEYPKQPMGWHTVDHGRMSAVLHQDVMMYRAVGVMYDKSKFRVRKRKKSVRGVWVLLEMVEGGQELWVGSLHLPVNEVVEEVHRLLDEFMEALPATDKPALLLGDTNTHFTWGVLQGVATPGSMRSRWSKLRQVTVERGFAQVAPRVEDACTPTFVPRRAGASSTQIDGCFAARCHITPVQVEKDSRHEVGTDHERVSARVLLRKGRRTCTQDKHQAGGPRRVCSTPPPQEELTETILQSLAQKHTKPASLGQGFKISVATRALQREAKLLKTTGAWKLYLTSLRREKDEWKASRVNKASQDWGTYKQLSRTRKGWVEGLMVASQSETPEQDVVQHFTEVFHDAGQPDTVQNLCVIADEIRVEAVVPFSPEEVRQAFLEGKKCKAVGPDGVPLEMLLTLVQDECTLQSFVSYFNSILCTGKTPQDWSKSVAT